jgi:hypothetical protein
VAAVAAGLAGDLLGDVKWPWVGRLEPSRVVLLCSGLLVLAVSSLVREHSLPEVQTETTPTAVARTDTGADTGAPAPETSQPGTGEPGTRPPETSQEATA